MGESTKAVCGLLIIIGSLAAVFAWADDTPDTVTWGFRIGGPALAILALALILVLHFRADLADDYLRHQFGTYFNRDGFCFAFSACSVDGIAHMEVYFQNQFDNPSIGMIGMRPSKGFLTRRKDFEMITFRIDCPPAGFGMARLPIPIPIALQGKRLSFEVGASVKYPNGKGRRLRFHDGVFLRANANFSDDFRTAITAVAAAGGVIVLSKPATAKITLPVAVAESIPPGLPSEATTLWKLGDPPL